MQNSFHVALTAGVESISVLKEAFSCVHYHSPPYFTHPSMSKRTASTSIVSIVMIVYRAVVVVVVVYRVKVE